MLTPHPRLLPAHPSSLVLQQGSVEGALKYLDLVDALATWLVAQGQRQGGAGAGAAQRGPDDEPALSGACVLGGGCHPDVS